MERIILEHCEEISLSLLWDMTLYKVTYKPSVKLVCGNYTYEKINKTEKIYNKVTNEYISLTNFTYSTVIETMDYKLHFDRFVSSNPRINKELKVKNYRHGNEITWNNNFELRYLYNYSFGKLNYIIIYDIVNIPNTDKRKIIEKLNMSNLTYSSFLPFLKDGLFITCDSEGKIIFLCRHIGEKYIGLYEPCKDNRTILDADEYKNSCSKTHQKVLTEESYQYYHNEIMKTIEDLDYIIKFL
mgnify:CR=1 FL=1